VNTLMAQLIFLSEPNFCNLFEFLGTKSTHKSISSTDTHTHLSSENCEINSIKSDSLKAFQQPRMPPNSNTVFSLDFI
jgi:hypothetical protein